MGAGVGRARPRGKGARDRVGCRGGTRGGASEVRRGWGGGAGGGWQRVCRAVRREGRSAAAGGECGMKDIEGEVMREGMLSVLGGMRRE